MTKHSNVIDEILEDVRGLGIEWQTFTVFETEKRMAEAKQSLATELVRMMEEAIGQNLKPSTLVPRYTGSIAPGVKKSTKLSEQEKAINRSKRETRTRLTAIIERELR